MNKASIGKGLGQKAPSGRLPRALRWPIKAAVMSISSMGLRSGRRANRRVIGFIVDSI
jgi:hypothetical protein